MEDLIPSVSLGAAATIATAAGLAYYCLTSQEEPAHTVVPVDDQSVAVDVSTVLLERVMTCLMVLVSSSRVIRTFALPN